MIEVIVSSKIDQHKWDRCVENSSQGNVYGLYASISKACDTWLGIIYNDYEAVLALPLKKKLGLSYSWHPQFMGPLGVFGNDKKAITEIFRELSSHSWWIKMYYWQERKPAKFIVKERLYQQLSLHEGIDVIRKNYNDNTKRNIKKATKAELLIKDVKDVQLVLDTFKENKGVEIDNIDEKSYQLLKKLMMHWQKSKLGYITGVYDQDELMAIGYFLEWKDTVIYYKGAVTQLGKEFGAMHYLIDHEIKNSVLKYKTFDFGGSNTSSVARFYKGFGGTDHRYYEYEFRKFKII